MIRWKWLLLMLPIEDVGTLEFEPPHGIGVLTGGRCLSKAFEGPGGRTAGLAELVPPDGDAVGSSSDMKTSSVVRAGNSVERRSGARKVESLIAKAKRTTSAVRQFVVFVVSCCLLF